MTDYKSRIRGRFAPTPSGPLHLGNAAAALMAWLQARSRNGEMVLRMEDLDRPRCKPEWAARVLEDMRWLGLDWDEGPDVGGPHAPYEQSRRYALYEQALERLQLDGRLYRCYCSRADLLSMANAPHGLGAEGPAYPGTCRSLTEAERAAREAVKTPSLRFALPDRPVSFEDGVAGEMTFPPGAGGDFVVKRADGIIGYQLAVVVDDAAMGITEVVRGWDLLDSTPRQLLLYEALGMKPPRFAHVPLLLGPDGGRLSKRHGSISLSALRGAGVRPQAIVGLLAWLYGLIDRAEPVEAKDLLPLMDWGKVPRGSIALPQDWLRRLEGAG